MPKLSHEFLIEAFRTRPELVPELTSRQGVATPPYTKITVADSNLSQVAPTAFQADLVLRLENDGKVVASLVVEVQLQVDHDKELTWPAYGATERASSGAPTWVVVLAPYENVAKWAREPIDCGGWVFQAVVVGSSDIPRVETLEEALRSVELAVLSLLAHWKEEGAERLMGATLGAIDHLGDLDETRSALYYEYVALQIGPDQFDKLLERAMDTEGFQFAESALAKRWLSQGSAKGRVEGRVEGRAEALLRQMNKRFGPLSPETTEQILAASIEQLDRGTDAILEAESLAEVLDAVGAG